nr:M4 family metallopeptidase [Nocardia macrotermitis]
MLVAGSAGAVSARPPDVPTLVAAPKRIHRDAAGSVRQVVPDRPVPRVGASGGAAEAALAHTAAVQQLFGAVEVGKLLVQKVSRRSRGSTVRLAQSIDAVPVYGAAVALALQPDGSLLSASGALAERVSGNFPQSRRTPSSSARDRASATAAGLAGVPVSAVRVRSGSAAWFDPELTGSGPEKTAVPAYRFEITAAGVGWRVFVAADSSGAVLDAWRTAANLTRVICDANSRGAEPELGIPCGADGSYPVVRAEGQGRVRGNDDANKVYDWIGDTEKFYAAYTELGSLTELIGIDAHDGRGKALRAHVRVCPESCPYANAFWSDTEGFVMGGAVLGLDVVAHELTHGVTEQTSGLDYLNEAGAINESLSDVFGELAELTTRAKHSAGDRWKIGNGTQVGVIRDMKSPADGADPQPETYHGPGWAPATYSDRNRVPDLGGVHINSGVGNKLAFLITDGGTFTRRKIRGIGVKKAAALYWTVQTELYPSADYPALANTLLTACHELVLAKSGDLTDSDCDQVHTAVEAVRIPLREARA